MVADFYSVLDNFINFIGGRSGILHWGMFCVSLLVCFFLGKRERKLLFWPTLLILLFFFNPLFYRYVGNRFFGGVYWRLMWMVPVSFIVAYAGTHTVYRIKKQAVRIVAVALALVCIVLTGKNIYNTETFTEAENLYKLPQAAIDVGEVMGIAGVGWKVKVIVPDELLCYIRQYRCDVGLLYGRNVSGFISGIGDDEVKVHEQMIQKEPDVALITELAKKNDVVFICFNTATQKIPEDMSGYGYYLYREVGDYSIYRRGE